MWVGWANENAIDVLDNPNLQVESRYINVATHNFVYMSGFGSPGLPIELQAKVPQRRSKVSLIGLIRLLFALPFCMGYIETELQRPEK